MKLSLRTWIVFCLLSVALRAEQPLVLPGGGYIVDLEGATPSVSDFEDFLALAKAFNTQKGDAHYTPYADLTCDGTINFSDFLIFASGFSTGGSISGGPEVVSVFPMDGSSRANVRTDVRVTFSTVMDTAAFGGFTLRQAATHEIVKTTASLLSDDKTVSLVAQGDLDTATEFVVVVSPTVVDAAGNALGRVYAWRFTTQGTPPPDPTFALPFAVEDIDLVQKLINPFGPIRHSRDSGIGHPGIDIPLKTGAPFFAVADGILVEVLPGSGGRPGNDVKLLIGADEPAQAGWIFEYEHIALEPGIGVNSRVTRGQLFARTPDPPIANYHLQLSYWENTFTSNHMCWVDFLADLAFVAHFNETIRTSSEFISGWKDVQGEGQFPFRGFLDLERYPEGTRLCYPLGTDVRIPVE
ncbi:MAG: Ig-like domain-containing protein [bacterium]|nr:Ig-like domain-containing protein [bacterium]